MVGLIAFATTLFFLACALAYAEELGGLTRSFVGAGAAGEAAPPGPRLLPTPAAEPPSRMLESLVRDLEGPDPRRWDRALEHLANYPPGELSRALIPLLDGPADARRDQIADLLLRHGGEDVLEPLHRYFLGREGSLESAAGPTEAPPPTRGRSRETATAERRGNVIFLKRRGSTLSARDLGKPAPARKSLAEEQAFPLPVLSLDPALRARAIADLPGTGHPQAYDLLSKVVRGDPDPLVRAAAAAALGGAAGAPSALAALATATRDRDPSVRWNACYALGKLGTKDAKVPLRRAENDVDGSVRLAARKALESLGLDPPVPVVS